MILRLLLVCIVGHGSLFLPGTAYAGTVARPTADKAATEQQRPGVMLQAERPWQLTPWIRLPATAGVHATFYNHRVTPSATATRLVCPSR